MKSFLEEYGFAILAAIVVILLIAMCTPVGNLIKNQVMGVVESFAGKTESKLAAADAGEKTLRIKQSAKVEDVAQTKIDYEIASPSTTDTFKLEYRVKTQAGWSEYKALNPAVTNAPYNADVKNVAVEANLGNAVQFRMIDNGTGEIVESNIVDLLS